MNYGNHWLYYQSINQSWCARQYDFCQAWSLCIIVTFCYLTSHINDILDSTFFSSKPRATVWTSFTRGTYSYSFKEGGSSHRGSEFSRLPLECCATPSLIEKTHPCIINWEVISPIPRIIIQASSKKFSIFNKTTSDYWPLCVYMRSWFVYVRGEYMYMYIVLQRASYDLPDVCCVIDWLWNTDIYFSTCQTCTIIAVCHRYWHWFLIESDVCDSIVMFDVSDFTTFRRTFN
jgi:hypothetical protein